jgi:hypothetical protein
MLEPLIAHGRRWGAPSVRVAGRTVGDEQAAASRFLQENQFLGKRQLSLTVAQDLFMAVINLTKIVKNRAKQACEAGPVKLHLCAGLYRRHSNSGCFGFATPASGQKLL